jgi:hypothetical protein
MNEENVDAPVESVDDVVDQPITMDEATTESSTVSEENHEQKSSGAEKRINKLTAQRYEQERRAEAAEARIAEMEAAKPAETITPDNAPQLPADQYDQEAMQAYHNDMLKYTQETATSAANKAFEGQQKAGQVAQQQTEMQKVVSTFANNAIRDGVDMDKLRAAEQTLNQAGITPQLGEFLMKDQNGGKIAEFLHDNPSVMHEVLSMDPISAGHKIMTEIKPRALSTTPKVSNAPEPTPDIKGGGATDKDDFDRANPGTTFI